jgi:hypothetical protein
MTKRIRISRSWTAALTGLGLAGACTVVDKGDYTFTDDPDDGEGGEGSNTGGKGGSSGSSNGGSSKGGASGAGTSGDAGDGSGGTETGGTSAGGTSGGGSGGTGGAGDECDPNPCENDGTCIVLSGGGTKCDCAAGYTGETCKDEIDECDPNPCVNNAPCTDKLADFSCTCPREVTGKFCELPRFQGIPAPGGMGATLARSVSADGTVVLGEVSGLIGTVTVHRPFVWTAVDGAHLVSLPSVIRADVSVRPWSISGDGTFWVGEYHNANMGGPNPIGGSTEPPGNNPQLPTFMLPPNAIGGYAFDTNMDGTRSVGNFTDTAARAIQWDETGVAGPLPNPYAMAMPPFATANAVTRDGTVAAGTVKDGMGNVFIYFWAATGTTAPSQVRTMSGITDVEAHGVSADAKRVAGVYWDAAFTNVAFVTDGSRFIPLVNPSNPVPPRSIAWDVSDDGNFIAGEIEGMPGMPVQLPDVLEQTTQVPTTAVIWKPDATFRTIVDMLRDSGVMPAGWVLQKAYGLSADGKVVVGAATDPQGVPQGFIARLP